MVADSKRLQLVKQEAYAYFIREVDPIISNCITFLLMTMPETNVMEEMLKFFSGQISQEEINSICLQKTNSGLIARREQRMYLATKVSPILTALVNDLAKLQPKNVMEYLCEKLTQMIKEPAESEEKSLPKPSQRRPFSARGKLTEAVAMDQSYVHANEIVRPGTAPNSSSVMPLDPPETKKKPMLPPGEPLCEPEPRSIHVALLGVGGSGKTSIINALQGNSAVSAKPTLGFRPTTMMLGNDVRIHFYDLGGGKKIRDIWSQYYHDIHAYMFVVDSATVHEEQEADEVRSVFKAVQDHQLLKGKPVLLVGNKRDKESSISPEKLCELLSFQTNRLANVIGCTAVPPNDILEENAAFVDKSLEEGIEWLLAVVNGQFDELDSRVQRDTKVKQLEEQRKRTERERKVLKNKIASAFFSSLNSDVIPPNVEAASPEEIYDEVEGVKFLADEVGVEELPDIAKQIAALIGYQRLALQMVGALNAPINKKKEPMSWEDIHQLVTEIRQELQL